MRYPLQLDGGRVTLEPMPPSENRTVQRVFRGEEMRGMGGMYSAFGSSRTGRNLTGR
jgi:hypothetical protein